MPLGSATTRPNPAPFFFTPFVLVPFVVAPFLTVLPGAMNMVRMRIDPCMPIATLANATRRSASARPISSSRTSCAVCVG